MQGHQHLLLGTVAGLAGSTGFSDPAAGIAFCTACMIGSIYPDIDLQTSKMGRQLRPASALIHHIFGHRGFIHTPVNGILLYIIIVAILGQFCPEFAHEIAGGFITGFFLHLCQDTITKGGIMWFWPIKWKIHLTNIGSNNPLCYVITVIMAVIVVAAFLYFSPAAKIPMLIGS